MASCYMTTGPTSEFVSRHLELSREFLDDSETLLEDRRFRSAVDRAYYAIHYSAVALLCHSGVRPPRTHSGLVNVFGQEVVGRGAIEGEFGRIVNVAMQRRTLSTYSADSEITFDDAQAAVADAARFLAEVSSIIEL